MVITVNIDLMAGSVDCSGDTRAAAAEGKARSLSKFDTVREGEDSMVVGMLSLLS